MDPEKYGQERIAECAPADPAREAVDELLMQDAANLYKPLFGICYGFQAWNVWRGGALIQDLQTGVNHKPGREVREAHLVSVAGGSKLGANRWKKELTVNSSHHQGLARPGDGLTIVARSCEDGLIEAVEGAEDQFVIAVQWHPERSFDYDTASKAHVCGFCERCGGLASARDSGVGRPVNSAAIELAVREAGLKALSPEAAAHSNVSGIASEVELEVESNRNPRT